MASKRRFRWTVPMFLLIFLFSLVIINSIGMTPYKQNKQNCWLPALSSVDQYMKYINDKQAACNNWVQLGGWNGAPDDGKKFLCLDERFRLDRNDCVVLSFGVNNEWSFEDDAERLGCKVYAFDPSMGVRDHLRSRSIRFFSLGISDYQGEMNVSQLIDIRAGRGKELPVDRYENIVRRLGLEGRVIDFVKMDIELSELDVRDSGQLEPLAHQIARITTMEDPGSAAANLLGTTGSLPQEIKTRWRRESTRLMEGIGGLNSLGYSYKAPQIPYRKASAT
ncbi:methyltransferase-like protein 24 [Penaeus monodon]|uniref:methyltransferase-like protein 24 n=1 Tax=Penaeus monodon TaxID=6687 RepID=UPI0018A7B00C|nr:methyltransferase-like protein 24 [Penaeus monodon]